VRSNYIHNDASFDVRAEPGQAYKDYSKSDPFLPKHQFAKILVSSDKDCGFAVARLEHKLIWDPGCALGSEQDVVPRRPQFGANLEINIFIGNELHIAASATG
jgi:hypothetical protein